MPIEITDPGDERVRDYFTLTDVALRTKVEPERGLYLAESEKVIRRALAAGHRPISYLMSPRWLADLADLVAAADERLAEQRLAAALVAVDVRGVEERDARLERGIDHGLRARLVDGTAEVVATEPDNRDVERSE